VCRILDFGKYRFEEEKKERAAKKNQHTSELKELRLRPRTDDHDLAVRSRAARKFLEEGHKVKLQVRFRGRENTHPEVARAQIHRIAQDLADIAVLERLPEIEGRGMYAILARGRPKESAPRPRPSAPAPGTATAVRPASPAATPVAPPPTAVPAAPTASTPATAASTPATAAVPAPAAAASVTDPA
jgi:translation initiation factor IF-3